MSTPAMIFEDDEIQVLHRPGASAFSLVTFGGLTHRADGRSFWGDGPATRFDLDTVGFMPKRENWYPAAAMRRAAAAVRPHLKPVAVGYGFSMGGYAALKYAAPLGLTHVFAVSPQVSIDPADMPGEPRYHRFFRPALHAGMRVGPGDIAPFSVVVADPYDPPDQAHVEALGQLPGLHRLPVPFTTHGAIWLFAQAEALREVLDLVVATDMDALRRWLRQRRKQSQAWYRFLGRAALGRAHAAAAECFWARATQLGMSPEVLRGERAAGTEQLVYWHLRHKHPDRAAALATEATTGVLAKDAMALLRIGNRLVQARLTEAALAPLGRAIALDPVLIGAHRSRAYALNLLQRTGEALDAYADAAGRFPEDFHIHLGWGHALFAAGKATQAAEAFAVAERVAPDDTLQGTALLALSHALARAGDVAGARLAALRASAVAGSAGPASTWYLQLGGDPRALPGR